VTTMQQRILRSVDHKLIRALGYQATYYHPGPVCIPRTNLTRDLPTIPRHRYSDSRSRSGHSSTSRTVVNDWDWCLPRSVPSPSDVVLRRDSRVLKFTSEPQFYRSHCTPLPLSTARRSHSPHRISSALTYHTHTYWRNISMSSQVPSAPSSSGQSTRASSASGKLPIREVASLYRDVATAAAVASAYYESDPADVKSLGT